MKKTSVQINEQAFNIFNNKLAVMRIFFLNPTSEFTVTDVASKTGLSKATASKVIEELGKRNLVTIVPLGVAYRIRANIDSDVFIREKIAFNISSILRSSLVPLLIEKFHNPKCIILFGSYRKGEDMPGSDIDLGVEASRGAEPEIFSVDESESFEKEFGRKPVIHLFNQKDINPNVFENMVNGFVIYGFLELAK